jgi:general secretion pathway protein D
MKMSYLKCLGLATLGFLMSRDAAAYTSGVSPEPVEHILNFDDVALSDLIADVSTVTGYTFIVHPDARSRRVTVSSATPLSKQAVFEVFLSTLRIQGFAAIPSGQGVYRIVPEESALAQAGQAGSGQNSFVTEVFELSHITSLDAARMVKPVTDAQGQVIANDGTKTLIVVDYAENLPRLRKLVAQIDVDPMVSETVSLANIPASEVARILTSIGDQPSQNGQSTALKAIAAGGSNSIVLYGSPADVDKGKRIARELDLADRQQDALKVIPLNNATAQDIVPILQQMALAMDGRRVGGNVGDAAATTIAHHEATNSLVISAPPETLAGLEKVIADLDRRRSQVLVEAIIVEMSDDTARELGLQFLLSGTNSSTVPFISTNYSRSAPNLLALTGALAKNNPFVSGTGTGSGTAVSNSFTQAAVSSLLGLTGLTIGAGGESGDTLFGAVLTAVQNDTKSRILSKPFNMTLDNGTSSLLVGQEVPISTGEVLGNANTNPFRTVERKKIGVGLDVTPRISNDGTIRLEIKQEVSSISGSIGTVTPDLIFNTREINTSVIADDGEIIVIGGLVQQDETKTDEKVPFLGDIPFAGRLFRSEGKARGRTNLMVFIRPTIVRDREAASRETARSYSYIRAEELWESDGDARVLDGFFTEVLGSPPPK